VSEPFLHSLGKHFEENLQEIGPLQKMIREKAWDRFLERGLPTKKMAGYQYLPLSQFYQESFDLAGSPEIDPARLESYIHPHSQRSHVVFVNGQYRPELSDMSGVPEKVVVRPLKDALNGYGNFLQMRLCRTLEEEVDPFVLLNIALIQMGLFIYVPPKVVVEAPIQTIHLGANEQPMIFSPRTHCFLGAHAKMEWMSRHHHLTDFDYFSNGVMDVVLEEGAQFHKMEIISPSKHGWHFEALRATLKRDSHLHTLSMTRGAKAVRQDFHVDLMGENASCNLKGGAILSDSKQAHVNVLIDHRAPDCQSSQCFKNIVADVSRSSFEGKIYVHPAAQKTDAYQLNNNLILGERAMANSKPNLEVFADDVKASHGATVSQLNAEHLHYLKTRGIGEKEGKQLLLSGFTLDLLREIPIPAMQDLMEAQV